MFPMVILTLANLLLVNVKRPRKEKSDDNNCLSYLIWVLSTIKTSRISLYILQEYIILYKKHTMKHTAAIANQNLRAGAVVLFTVVPDLLAHLRATFSSSSTEPYDQRFAKMREAELLVLDDLGSHQSSPWANEKLFQLLNYRYNSHYPTVITANKQGLIGIDERILSRISDTALVTRVIINGAIDFRPHNPRR